MQTHMATTLRPNWALVIRQSILAGFVGALVFDAYVWLTTVAPVQGSLVAMLQHSGSIALGPLAYTSPSYAWAGVAVDLVSSMAWAGGYAYFAQQRPYVNARWPLSGFFYGFVVYVLMLLVLLGAHAFVNPSTPQALFNDVIARTVFFGVPVAFVVAQLDRT